MIFVCIRDRPRPARGTLGDLGRRLDGVAASRAGRGGVWCGTTARWIGTDHDGSDVEAALGSPGRVLRIHQDVCGDTWELPVWGSLSGAGRV